MLTLPQINGGSGVVHRDPIGRVGKSLVNLLNNSHPNQKNINKNELKPLDTLFRSLKDEKDWICFSKLFYLYFEGVISMAEFFVLFDDKFSTKLR